MTTRLETPGLCQLDVRNEIAAGADPEAVPNGPDGGDGLDSLTKDELLEEAEGRGVEVKTSASKAEILAALRG